VKTEILVPWLLSFIKFNIPRREKERFETSLENKVRGQVSWTIKYDNLVAFESRNVFRTPHHVSKLRTKPSLVS
jgi:hypothetical protein